MAKYRSVSQIAILLIVFTKSQLYSKNLIVNGNFSQINFTGINRYFSGGVKGWTCSNICQIDNCNQFYDYSTNLNSFFPICSGNVIDLNSVLSNQIVSQQIELKSGQYQLNFTYFNPIFYASQKFLNVSFNNNSALYVHPQSGNVPFQFHFSSVFEGLEGTNTLTFMNLGLNDGEGFKISEVTLVRILDQNTQKYVLGFFQFRFIEQISSFPGGRVILGSICSFLINLDRYELYGYHNRLYSYNEQLLLKNIHHLSSMKGQLFRQLQYNSFSQLIQDLEIFWDSLNYKRGYITYHSFDKQITNDTFSQYLSDLIIYALPAIVVAFISLNVLFRLLFNSRISTLFRQYSFYGILLPLFLEGNIEELTFYIFAQFKTFFQFSFKHKLFNIFIIIIFFIVFIMCFGVFFLFKYHYQKKAKYVIGIEHSFLKNIFNQNFDRGIIVFFYGATHQLMIDSPTAQLMVLGILETILITKKIIMRKYYVNTFLNILSIFNGLLRIYFQITTHLYSIIIEERKNINQNFHKSLIILLIFYLGLEIGFGIYLLVKRAMRIRKYKCEIINNSNGLKQQQSSILQKKRMNQTIFCKSILKKHYQIIVVQV